MAKTKISEFSATPANNTDIDSINIAEGCSPSGINDAIRELMAQLKDFQTGAVGDSFNGPVGTTTAAAGAFTTLSASGNVTLSGGTANGVAYLNGSKVVTSGSALVFDGTSLGVGTATIPANVKTVIASPNTAVNSRGNLYVYTTDTATADFGAQLTLGGSFSGTSEAPFAAIAGRWVGGTTGYMQFSILNSGTVAEQMRLTSTGLGIGTSSPASGGGGGLTLGTTSSGKSFHVYSSSYANNGLANFYGTDGNMKLQMGALSSTSAYVFANTGCSLVLFSGGNTSATLDTSGNLGLGVTPSAWGGSYAAMQMKGGFSLTSYPGTQPTGFIQSNAYFDGSNWKYISTGYATRYKVQNDDGAHSWDIAPSGTAGNAITFTQAATLTAGGDFLVGTTSVANSSRQTIGFVGSTTNGLSINDTEGTTVSVGYANFSRSGTSKGSVTYSNTSGLVSYNTTSDYRAKDIYGVIADSGSVIDSVPVYMGKMKGATQERPMFIAHETPSYAHTGVKDAVDEDGNPVYQQMDASALIPVMWAEIQSLRKRLADAGL